MKSLYVPQSVVETSPTFRTLVLLYYEKKGEKSRKKAFALRHSFNTLEIGLFLKEDS